MYILNIPVYQYNTGRADNGNKVFKHIFNDLQEAKLKLEFVNNIYSKIEQEIELNEEEQEKYLEFFDLPGYQINKAYITNIIETKI